MLGFGKESKFKKSFDEKLRGFGFQDAALRSYLLPAAFEKAKKIATSYSTEDIWASSPAIPKGIDALLKERRQEEVVMAMGARPEEFSSYWKSAPMVQQMWWATNELIVLSLTLKIEEQRGKEHIVNELKSMRAIYGHPFDTHPHWVGQDARIPLEFMPRVTLWLGRNGIDPFNVDHKQPLGNSTSVNANVRTQIANGAIPAPTREDLWRFYSVD